MDGTSSDDATGMVGNERPRTSIISSTVRIEIYNLEIERERERERGLDLTKAMHADCSEVAMLASHRWFTFFFLSDSGARR
jgi:hypothetical protein